MYMHRGTKIWKQFKKMQYNLPPWMCQEFGISATLQFQEWTAWMTGQAPIQRIQPMVGICKCYRRLHPTERCWTRRFPPWWQVNRTSSRTTTKLQDGDQSSSRYRERICLCHRSRPGLRFRRSPRKEEKHHQIDSQTGLEQMLLPEWHMAGQEESREYMQSGWRFLCAFGTRGTRQLLLWWLPPSCQTKKEKENNSFKNNAFGLIDGNSFWLYVFFSCIRKHKLCQVDIS